MKKASVKLIIGLILLVSTLVIGGCFISKPRDSIVSFFKAWQAMDFQEAANFLASGDVPAYLKNSSPEIFTAIYSQLKWEIVSEVISRDTALVTVRLENVNILEVTGNIIYELLGTSLAAAFAGEAIAEQDVEQLITKSFRAADAPKEIKVVQLSLIKSAGNWLIISDDELNKALFLGLEALFDVME